MPLTPSARSVAFVCATLILLASAFPTGETQASFTAATRTGANSVASIQVAAPALNASVSASAGHVQVTWSASATAASEPTLRYRVLRRPTGIGSFLEVATALTGLTYTDLPGADGTYDYRAEAYLTGFTADSATQTGISDRLAPSVAIQCNAAPCAGWYAAAVTVTVTGTDGGSGTASVTTAVDGGTAGTTAGGTRSVSLTTSLAHSVAYSAADVAGNASGTVTQTVSVDVIAPTAAAALTAVTGTTTGSVNLAWTAGTDALSGVAGYTVRYVLATTCPAATPTNYPNTRSVGAVASTVVTGLTSGSRYCFYLQTLDVAGNVSVASNVPANAKAK